MDQYDRLNTTNPSSTQLFNYKGSLKFIIHGYLDSGLNSLQPTFIMSGMQLVKDFDGYVILVDWGNIANCSYEESVAEINPSVAQHVADIIGSFNFDPERIEVIGHSFGGQIAGLVGATLNGRLERITALSPAGPGYDEPEIGLNKSCAQFVQVLHTDINGVESKLKRGDADFYANNGTALQPACESGLCGHSKAVYYHLASLFPQYKFIGVACGQMRDSSSNETSRFGEFNDGKHGTFCFDTTGCFPYAKIIDI